jgi:hypothetical protein
MTLDYDADQHQYRVNGAHAFSVTQVLDYFGLVSQFCKSEFHSERGTNGHEWFKLCMTGEIEEYEVPDSVQMWIQAFMAFKSQHVAAGAQLCEQKLGSLRGYAGTLDLLTNDWHLFDAKFWSTVSQSSLKTAGYQTAGYSELIKENLGKYPKRRSVVHFHEKYPEGFRVFPLKSGMDQTRWNSMINVLNMQKEHGAIKEEL